MLIIVCHILIDKTVITLLESAPPVMTDFNAILMKQLLKPTNI